jgi:hypothetical protein
MRGSWAVLTVICAVARKMARLERELEAFLKEPRQEVSPKKVFVSKHRIPLLLDYSGTAPEGWWEHWPFLSWEEGRRLRSSISPGRMREWARKASHPDMAAVQEICDDLTVGCDLGTRGEFLCPSVSTNAPSAYQYGDRVTDSVADGVKQGIMMGPLREDQIPFKEEGIKENGIMVTIKPNGVARVILNMSRGYPFCVNDGMNNEGRFEISMSSTSRWLRVMHRVGRGAWVCKLDWAAAYKQLRVREDCVREQFFRWCGRWFAELCLVFGGASSVGLYDRLAKVFLYIAVELSGMPRSQVEQIIDDVVAAGTYDQVVGFYSKYREVAEHCGVRLAPEDDPKKAFAAAREGEVFGIEYCTKSFTWWLREDKVAVIMEMLGQVEEGRSATLGLVKSVTGKLVHYRLLVPMGKFYLGQLIRMGISGQGDRMDREVEVTEWARAEACYWIRMLQFCGRRTLLPDPDFSLPPWILTADTDAAGGTTKGWGYGAGGVMGDRWWCYVPWGEAINQGGVFRDGVQLSSKMSAWELVGPLLVLTSGAGMLRGKSLIIQVDNAGSVAIYKKGWCTSCMLCTTLALAICEVAVAINCKLEIKKVMRCSTQGARAADALSKGDFMKFRRLKPKSDANPARVPQVLWEWVQNPVEDRKLGEKLLVEMGVRKNELGIHSAFV